MIDHRWVQKDQFILYFRRIFCEVLKKKKRHLIGFRKKKQNILFQKSKSKTNDYCCSKNAQKSGKSCTWGIKKKMYTFDFEKIVTFCNYDFLYLLESNCTMSTSSQRKK